MRLYEETTRKECSDTLLIIDQRQIQHNLMDGNLLLNRRESNY